MEKKNEKCCICGKEFIGWGNEPWPIKQDGECCDECTYFVIIKKVNDYVFERGLE